MIIAVKKKQMTCERITEAASFHLWCQGRPLWQHGIHTKIWKMSRHYEQMGFSDGGSNIAWQWSSLTTRSGWVNGGEVRSEWILGKIEGGLNLDLGNELDIKGEKQEDANKMRLLVKVDDLESSKFNCYCPIVLNLLWTLQGGLCTYFQISGGPYS